MRFQSLENDRQRSQRAHIQRTTRGAKPIRNLETAAPTRARPLAIWVLKQWQVKSLFAFLEVSKWIFSALPLRSLRLCGLFQCFPIFTAETQRTQRKRREFLRGLSS